MDKNFEKDNIFGLGRENSAFAQYFIGRSYLNPLTPEGVVPFMANVTFEPGCRNNWHIHRSRAAATIGISTALRAAADRFCCALPERGGIRSGACAPAA